MSVFLKDGPKLERQYAVTLVLSLCLYAREIITGFYIIDYEKVGY